MSQPEFTDIRLIPVTAEHHAALTSTDPVQLVLAVQYVISAYEKAPPLTFTQAQAYASDTEWWRNEIADL